MPPIRLPTLPPTGGLDFAPVPEGESGLDIQISPGRMGGGGNTFDTAVAGAELQYAYFYFNFQNGSLAADGSNAPGTFMTDFSGTILAGRRLDGAVPAPPAFSFANIYPPNSQAVGKTGLSTDIKVVSGASLAVPGIYSPYGGTGLDIFYIPSAIALGKKLSVFVTLPDIVGNGYSTISLIAANVPYIINNPQIVVPGYVNILLPNSPIKTAPRPEGYLLPGETGLQVYAINLGAVDPQPAPFQPLPASWANYKYPAVLTGGPPAAGQFVWSVV